MVASCSKFTQTGLWVIPLTWTPTEQPELTFLPPSQDTVRLIYSAYSTSISAELAQCHHQLCFAPPTSTVLKAIKNNQLTSFPELTANLLKRLPPFTATHKGHMKQHRQHLHPTWSNTEAIVNDRINPRHEPCVRGMCFARSRYVLLHSTCWLANMHYLHWFTRTIPQCFNLQHEIYFCLLCISV